MQLPQYSYTAGIYAKHMPPSHWSMQLLRFRWFWRHVNTTNKCAATACVSG